MPCLDNRALSCGAWSRANVYSATVPLSAGGASPTGTDGAAAPPSSACGAPGLSPGAITGIAIGAALGLGLACAASFLLGLKMNPRRLPGAAGGVNRHGASGSEKGNVPVEVPADRSGDTYELPNHSSVAS